MYELDELKSRALHLKIQQIYKFIYILDKPTVLQDSCGVYHTSNLTDSLLNRKHKCTRVLIKYYTKNANENRVNLNLISINFRDVSRVWAYRIG